MNLTEQQLNILNDESSKILVIAAAGSGKTALLTERVIKTLDDGADSSEIVVITFTNNAATEMRERIGERANGIFIGTIHSYAATLLRSAGISIKSMVQKEDFDGFFKLLKQNMYALNKVNYLFLDEAQDCNEAQFNFIFNILHPLHFFIIGDHRQAIYQDMEGRGRVDLFLGIASQPDVKTLSLNQNFRCGEAILDFAKWIINVRINEVSKSGIKYIDSTEGLYNSKGFKTTIPFDLQKIIHIITSIDEYKDWMILTRNNSQLETVKKKLESYDIPCDTFKQSEITNEEITARMKKNTVKILTIHSAKGLEAPNVMVVGCGVTTEEDCRLAYVAATRAENRLYWISNKKRVG